MSNIDWDKVYKYLEGTCKTPSDAVYFLALPCEDEDVELEMLDRNLQICPHCGWWVESYELLDENDDEDGHCENCR